MSNKFFKTGTSSTENKENMATKFPRFSTGRKAFKEITERLQNVQNKYGLSIGPSPKVTRKFQETSTQTDFTWPINHDDIVSKNVTHGAKVGSSPKQQPFEIFEPDVNSLNNILKCPTPKLKSKKPISIFNHPNINYKRENEFDIFECDTIENHIQETLKRYDSFLTRTKNMDIEIKRPAEKTKLLKKLHRRRSSGLLEDKVKSHHVDVYTAEYLEDIIQYEMSIESKYILKKSHLGIINSTYRIQVVDWLIKLLNEFDVHLNVFLMAIRIFDFTLAKLHQTLPNFKGYQLIGISCLWISLKSFCSLTPVTVHKLFSVCGGMFTKNEILNVERTVLEVINFDLNISDPMDFIHYFIKQDQMENFKDLVRATKFILEYSTLFPEYPHTLPSLVGEAGFLLAKILLGYEDTLIYNSDYNDRKTLELYTNLLLHQLKWLSEPKCPFKEVISRYNTPDNLFVSMTLLKKITIFDYV